MMPVKKHPAFVTDDPAFGIWQDHKATEDVETFSRSLRASRYSRDGSRTRGKHAG